MITENDLQNLATDASIEAKSVVAFKVADFYQQDTISQNAKNIVEDIFRIMLKDIEQKVREAVAVSLQDSKELPNDVVKTLIKDIDKISIPFIKKYQHFSFDDIIFILKTDNVDKHIAVALKNNVTYEISDYIVHNCHSRVVEALVVNKDAKILDETFEVIIQKYHEDEKIKSPLIERQDLPMKAIEEVITFLSDELLKKLIKNHQLPDNLASDVVGDLKEKAVLKISEELSTDVQIEELVQELYQNNRLTPSLIVRAICMGDVRFFEYGLAYLSAINILDVRKTLSNSKQDFMIRNLLRKAFIPKTMFPAIFSALEVVKELSFSCTKDEKKMFPQKVTERILSENAAGDGLTEDDVNYLISRIN